ncbi:MAG: spore gernimation protein [Clostridia bacterium]|nr:spore gernimation protein [Clostridia bacterium]
MQTQKEVINDKEAICLFTAFIFGSSLILGVGGSAKNDAWLAVITGIIMSVPILLVYIRLLSLYPGKDLFDILILTFGKIIGRIVAVFYILYSFSLGGLVFRNYGEFINTVALPETPLFVTILSLGLLSIIAVRLGIEVMGRTAALFLPIILLILAVVQLLVLPEVHFNYLKPVLAEGIGPVLMGGFKVFSFPFAETVLLIGVFSSLKTKKSPFKVFYWGILISVITIMILTVRNTGVLGNMADKLYFPAYEAVSRINIGDFLQRMEVTVSFVFFISVFVKSSVCLLVTSKGIAKMFNLKDYRSIVIQTGFLMIYFSYTFYDNIMEMKYWADKVYPYYVFPVQVILPIIIWITAEIKSRKKKQENAS